MACRCVKVAGRTFDRKVEGSSPDRNIIGCRQEGHPDQGCQILMTKIVNKTNVLKNDSEQIVKL